VNRHLISFALSAMALLGGVLGCSKSPTGAGFGHVTIHLTDAPGDFEQVNLVVAGVSIHRGGDENSGWETLKDDTTTFDLLELRNGVFTLLAVGDVPAGHYTQVRLHLGAGSNVVVDGVTHSLDVPSGTQSGYKLVGEFDVPAGGAVDLMLDFDAARSIHQTGAGQYKLQPTVRVLVNPETTTGQIIGHILPENVGGSVFAIAGTDTVQSTTPGSDGRFTLAALLAGTYSVAIHPGIDLADTTLTGVQVTAGATTDLGDIQLGAGGLVGSP
jgi:hypothetical protein